MTEDKGTGGQGDKGKRSLLVPLSPCLPVSLSPCLLVFGHCLEAGGRMLNVMTPLT
jgi:hypothetical protein